MTKIVIYLDGTPGQKGRPQFARTSTGVRAFNRPKTIKYESRLTSAGKDAWPWPPLTCPVRLTLTAVFPIAPSWPKWRRLLAAVGKLWHVAKPDLDNVIKIACDGLNEVIWKDDVQVCWIVARKFYGPAPGLWLEVDVLDDTGGVATPTGASEGGGAPAEG